MIRSMDEKTLSRLRLRRLMALAAKYRREPVEPPAAETFDWFKPHHLRPEDLARYDLLARRIERHLTLVCESLFQASYEISAGTCDQHYADRLAARVRTEQRNHYFLPLDVNRAERTGFVSLAPSTAIALVGLMLRDPEFAAGEPRELTTLEDSILMDAVAAMTDAVGRAMHESGGPTIQKASRFVQGDWPMAVTGLEDLFSIQVTIVAETDTLELTFTMLCEAIEPALGVRSTREAAVPPEELRQRVLKNVDATPIRIEAQLAEAAISLHDAMSLRPGDVLVLNKKITEPLDMVLNGRKCFRAFPARTATRLALVIAEPEEA